ncbi:hypothetical protein FN846DRAFT_912983 [Sphaerosporella brunnea]|uniref:Uncharacterized protein n=1 Tax=Sphaerosporella brunnea TaxID=1250544 RepID=A0A5J5EFB8_9PEZI|nr:hypothetical protein FN846DRAFT_912983 [Sphaerosporella brunnea]
MRTPIGVPKRSEMVAVRMRAHAVIEDVRKLQSAVMTALTEISIRMEESEETFCSVHLSDAFISLPEVETPELVRDLPSINEECSAEPWIEECGHALKHMHVSSENVGDIIPLLPHHLRHVGFTGNVLTLHHLPEFNDTIPLIIANRPLLLPIRCSLPDIISSRQRYPLVSSI